MYKPFQHGRELKKRYGQHFLRQQSVVDAMLKEVRLGETDSIFEIGGGDGFLTRAILQHSLARLWVFEIDQEWSSYLKQTIHDDRLTVWEQNFLDFDFKQFEPYSPWILLANLPYQVTFPILHLLQKNRHLLKEGVIMVQEEVAEKILKTSGKGYGYISLFFQYYFTWKKLIKISPDAFVPPPKVYSRLLYFKPRAERQPIAKEEEFWQFIKLCFRQPRRTLKNNLAQTHFALQNIPENLLMLRAQQMKFDDFIQLWQQVQNA